MKLQQICFLLLLLILLISSSKITKNCVCGHVRSQKECQSSGFCIWQSNECKLNSGQKYTIQIQDQKHCKYFAKEDCREQEQCGFYLGQCINFIDCMLFNRQYCQESSYKCVSDGTKCVQILDCNDYKTEIGCQNKSQNGGEKKCRDAKICEELPKYLTSHKMCKESFEFCTVNENGYGCIQQMESCSQYINDYQCFENNKGKNCFWNQKLGKCIEKECENLPFSQDYECQSYLSNCKRKGILNYIYYTSNGIHCVKKRECIDAKNRFGCVTDIQGKKCEYHQNECKIKSCNTASSSLTNYKQCQDYDNLLDCVTSENGGCKKRPETCSGYIREMDCYSVELQDCVWQNNKCEKRQCYHAPLYYSHTDCKSYGNCIGKLNGGCQLTPQ